MALLYYNRYPGRWNGSSAQYPQGSFKNRSAPGAKDGSWIEKDWANDWSAFFQALLKNANVTANGNVDTATASQYFDSLDSLYLRKAAQAVDSAKLGGQLPAYYAAASTLADKMDKVNAYGLNQVWQDVGVNRASGVTYTNTTGKPIDVIIGKNSGVTVTASVNGVSIIADSSGNNFTFVVPDRGNYVVTGAVVRWYEFR